MLISFKSVFRTFPILAIKASLITFLPSSTSLTYFSANPSFLANAFCDNPLLSLAIFILSPTQLN